MQTNLLKSEPPSGGLFAGIKKNIPDGKTSGMFQSVKKPSASLDTVGAAFRRPRNNGEAIVAVFEENKKRSPWAIQFCFKIAGRPMVAPTGYCGGFFDRSVLF